MVDVGREYGGLSGGRGEGVRVRGGVKGGEGVRVRGGVRGIGGGRGRGGCEGEGRV